MFIRRMEPSPTRTPGSASPFLSPPRPSRSSRSPRKRTLPIDMPGSSASSLPPHSPPATPYALLRHRTRTAHKYPQEFDEKRAFQRHGTLSPTSHSESSCISPLKCRLDRVRTTTIQHKSLTAYQKDRTKSRRRSHSLPKIDVCDDVYIRELFPSIEKGFYDEDCMKAQAEDHSSMIFEVVVLSEDLDEVLGSVEATDSLSFRYLRKTITEELDNLPKDFVFVYQGTPIGRNQEKKRFISNACPFIHLRRIEREEFLSEETVLEMGAPFEREVPGSSEKTADVILNVVIAAPLAFQNKEKKMVSMNLVNYHQERELLMKTLEETNRDIRVSFEFATVDSLRSIATAGCRCLHYSGHANPYLLSLEDGYGGLHLVPVTILKNLFLAGGPERKPQLVFVSACSSRGAGQAFVEAGVPHVVAVELDSDVLDYAASTFMRSFYLALFRGFTVVKSFFIAKESVKAIPNIDPSEAEKFLLLPPGQEKHERILFEDLPTRPFSKFSSAQNGDFVSDNLPTTPEGFVGRNVDMYRIINSICRHRLVSITGVPGIGKSAVSVAVANYVSERKYFRDGVFYVSLSCLCPAVEIDSSTGQTALERESEEILIRRMQSLIWSVISDQFGEFFAEYPEEELFTFFRRKRCLLVLDAFEFVNFEVLVFIEKLLQRTRGLTILLTCRNPIGTKLQPFSAGEKVHVLESLSPLDGAKLFTLRAPRKLSPEEFGVRTLSEMLTKISEHPSIKALDNIPSRIVGAASSLSDREFAFIVPSTSPDSR